MIYLQYQVEESLASMDIHPVKVNEQLSIFGLPNATLAAQIEQIRHKFLPYQQMWTTVYNFQTLSTQWMHGTFAAVDADTVERSIGQWISIARYVCHAYKYVLIVNYRRLLVEFEGQDVFSVAQKLYASLDTFREYVPLIVHLRNPGLRIRHWTALSTTLHSELGPGIVT